MDAIAGYHYTGHNEKKLMGSFIVQKCKIRISETLLKWDGIFKCIAWKV